MVKSIKITTKDHILSTFLNISRCDVEAYWRFTVSFDFKVKKKVQNKCFLTSPVNTNSQSCAITRAEKLFSVWFSVVIFHVQTLIHKNIQWFYIYQNCVTFIRFKTVYCKYCIRNSLEVK